MQTGWSWLEGVITAQGCSISDWVVRGCIEHRFSLERCLSFPFITIIIFIYLTVFQFLKSSYLNAKGLLLFLQFSSQLSG